MKGYRPVLSLIMMFCMWTSLAGVLPQLCCPRAVTDRDPRHVAFKFVYPLIETMSDDDSDGSGGDCEATLQ
jgi:hypothetical protein